MKKLKILVASLLAISTSQTQVEACSSYLLNSNNVKTSRATWNGDGSFICGSGSCTQENLKYTFWKPIKDQKTNLPRFQFSQDIPKQIRDLVLLKIEQELLDLPAGTLESQTAANEDAFAVGKDNWFNFGVIYPGDSPYFRALLAYANLQEGNFALDEDRDMYEILGGNLRLVSFFINREDMTDDAKANVLVHEFLHYFLNHSQGDTVKYDYLYEGAKKRQWVIGKIGDSVPIMYPTPAQGAAKIMFEDKVKFKEAVGLAQDVDIVKISGTVSWKGVPVKAARLTFVNLDDPEKTCNIEIDALKKELGEFNAILAKGRYNIRLESINPMFADLTPWSKINDKPKNMPTATFIRNSKLKRKVYNLKNEDLSLKLEF
jgi:hypothetical protein